jgi:hypothetical protein
VAPLVPVRLFCTRLNLCSAGAIVSKWQIYAVVIVLASKMAVPTPTSESASSVHDVNSGTHASTT